jgi:hypothetical protein
MEAKFEGATEVKAFCVVDGMAPMPEIIDLIVGEEVSDCSGMIEPHSVGNWLPFDHSNYSRNRVPFDLPLDHSCGCYSMCRAPTFGRNFCGFSSGLG